MQPLGLQGLSSFDPASLAQLLLSGSSGDNAQVNSAPPAVSSQSSGPSFTLTISIEGQLLANSQNAGQAGNQGQSLRTLALNAAASALNLSLSTVQSDLAAGQSLQQIAQNQGVNLSTVQSAITNAVQPQLDQAVSTGQITGQQEQHILSRLTHLGGHHRSGSSGLAGQYSPSSIQTQVPDTFLSSPVNAADSILTNGVSNPFAFSVSTDPAALTTRAS